jgi:hypothetical protein
MSNKFEVKYKQLSSNIFTFLDHKNALYCWAKINKKIKKSVDVITFDSHGDFSGGQVINCDLEKNLSQPDNKVYLIGKYIKREDIPHFTTSKEFMDWDPSNDEQNKEVVEKNKKYFRINNDNHIDIAFMKNIIKGVYWYYIEKRGNAESGKCDDYLNVDHNFISKQVDSFIQPKEEYILDIDLDFFVKENEKLSIFDEEIIRKYLKLQKKLFESDRCLALTIAFEPGCCGGNDNCKKLCKLFEEEVGIDILSSFNEMTKTEEWL